MIPVTGDSVWLSRNKNSRRPEAEIDMILGYDKRDTGLERCDAVQVWPCVARISHVCGQEWLGVASSGQEWPGVSRCCGERPDKA